MRKFLPFLCLLFLFGGVARGEFNRDQAVSGLRGDLESSNEMRLAYRTDQAIEGWVHFAVRELHEKGQDVKAEALLNGWEGHEGWRGFVPELVKARMEGSVSIEEVPELYNPLSIFLSDWYHAVKETLGDAATHAAHLDDIQVINYGLPIVFDLTGTLGDSVHVELPEYTIYWTPFCGVVAYWSVWAGCEVATYGTGWIFICMPAATFARKLTTRYIAPPLAKYGYRWAWQ